MATGFASALSEGQPAQLDLGEDAVPCLVVGFTGADVVLAPSAELPEDALSPGLTTYLLIDAGGTLQALKAEVRRAGTDGELVATLLDPFRLGQRRTFSRAPLVLPAHLRPLGGQDAAEDHLHPRHQRRRPARRAPVLLRARRRA